MQTIQQELVRNAIIKLQVNREKFAENNQKFIDKFEIGQEVGFTFTTFDFMKCPQCKTGTCHNPKCRGIRFFPVKYQNKLGKDEKSARETQNKLFLLAAKYKLEVIED